MRTIQPTNAYRRDYRRVKTNPRYRTLDEALAPVLQLLSDDMPLPVANRDHNLSGEYDDCRECHIRPDMLLIYRKQGADILQLVRLGSHSELFR